MTKISQTEISHVLNTKHLKQYETAAKENISPNTYYMHKEMYLKQWICVKSLWYRIKTNTANIIIERSDLEDEKLITFVELGGFRPNSGGS